MYMSFFIYIFAVGSIYCSSSYSTTLHRQVTKLQSDAQNNDNIDTKLSLYLVYAQGLTIKKIVNVNEIYNECKSGDEKSPDSESNPPKNSSKILYKSIEKEIAANIRQGFEKSEKKSFADVEKLEKLGKIIDTLVPENVIAKTEDKNDEKMIEKAESGALTKTAKTFQENEYSTSSVSTSMGEGNTNLTTQMTENQASYANHRTQKTVTHSVRYIHKK